MDLGSRSPIYDVLLLAHVVCAVGGFGANGLAGLYAGQLYPSPRDGAVKYFSTPKFYAEKLIYLVPVFGLVMIAVSHGISELEKPWVIAGITAWIIAVGVAHSVVWPAERKVALAIASDASGVDLLAPARKLVRGSMALDLIFVIAFVTMIAQPGGK